MDGVSHTNVGHQFMQSLKTTTAAAQWRVRIHLVRVRMLV